MSEKLKLNLAAPAWVPKSKQITQPQTNQKYIPTSLQQSKNPTPLSNTPLSFSNQHTKLSVLNSKSFVPKSYTPQIKIEREYFITETTKQIFKFDFDYMISFEKWEICSESKLLSENLIQHLKNFEIVETDTIKGLNNNKNNYEKKKNKKNYRTEDFKKETSNKNENAELAKWGRKDLTKELASAKEFKEKIDAEGLKDPIKFNITEYLNMLTVDNYPNTSEKIYEIIKDDINYQEKFLDVLFIKAVNEKAFVSLYAKLCKEFDKKLPQKNEKPGKKPTSMMRVKLLDKCREIFKIKNNEKFDQYINVKDKDEREQKLKNFVLGNVNFIGELINIQILSKKIVFQCIENLFTRYVDAGADASLKMINLEAIVILLDKFGTLFKKKESKLKDEDKKSFQEQINIYINKLSDVQNDKQIPGFIKYKIINLIERSKNNWEESKYAKSLKAKGKKDLEEQEEEIEISDKKKEKYSQEEVNNKIGKDLSNFRDHESEGGNAKNYGWEIVEDIYNVRRNSIADIMQGFIENCIDFVQNEKLLKLVKNYFKELINYYKKQINGKEKREIVNRTLHLIRVAHDYSLDNLMIIDVWSIILNTLIIARIFHRDDLLDLEDLGEEELQEVFNIIAKTIIEDPDGKKYFDSCKFVSKHQDLYDEALKKYNVN